MVRAEGIHIERGREGKKGRKEQKEKAHEKETGGKRGTRER